LVPLLSEEFQVAVQRSFGLPLTLLAGYVGEKIRSHANSAQCSVDKYGHKLQTVAGAKGDATRTLNGAFLAALAHSLRQAGIRFYGGGRNNRSCKQNFSYLIQAFVGAEEGSQRKISVIIADLLVDLTSVETSASRGLDAARSLSDLVRALCDAKTLALSGAYKSFNATHPKDQEPFLVEKRAAKVPKQYLAAARDLYRSSTAHSPAKWGRFKPSS
jgi:hypothetical protein